jgi:hypothetical protein
MPTEKLTLHVWLYNLQTGGLLTYDDTSGEWGALALLEETL